MLVTLTHTSLIVWSVTFLGLAVFGVWQGGPSGYWVNSSASDSPGHPLTFPEETGHARCSNPARIPRFITTDTDYCSITLLLQGGNFPPLKKTKSLAWKTKIRTFITSLIALVA